MTRPEGCTPLRDVLLDRHIRVAETHESDLVALLGQDSEFLVLARRALGLVVAGELVALVVDHLLLGSAYQPAGITTVAGPTSFLFLSKE